MAQLNFPQDRTELVPPGTGPLETGDTYTANGTTWVYNADAGVWGSGQGSVTNETYLRLDASNDPVTGTCEFAAGVSVTGGDIASVTTGLALDDRLTLCHLGADIFSVKNNATYGGLFSQTSQLTTSSLTPEIAQLLVNYGGTGHSDNTYVGVKSILASDIKSPDISLFNAGIATAQSDDNVIVKGFSSSIQIGNVTGTGSSAYNFYAAGNAPNYFAGLTEHDGGINSTKCLIPGTATLFNYYSNTGSSSVHSRITLDGTKTNLTGVSNKAYYTFISQPVLRQSSTITDFYGFSSQLNVPNEDVDFTGDTIGFQAGVTLGSKSLGSSYGFKSDIATDGTRTYNFYAAGNAPSYFNGGIVLGDDPNSPSNLKTYEFGTWTPGFRLTTDAGSFTYSVQSGSYTKVGRLVTCQGQITCTGKTGMTSAPLRLTGFPFPALNNGQHRDCGTVSIWQGFDDIRFPNAGIIMSNSVNEAELQCGTGGSTTANVRGQDFTSSTTRINFSITYTANS